MLTTSTVSVVNTKQTSSASVARSTAGPSTLSLHSAQNTQTGNSCSGFGHSPSSEIFSGAEKMLKRNTKSANLMGFLTGAQKSLQPKTSAGRSSIKSPPFGQSVTHSDVDVLNMPQEKACNKFSADVLSPRPPVCAAGVVNESKSVVEAVPKMCAVKSSSQHSSLPACTPLAERMRPTVLSDFVGQGHIVGSQRPLRSLLESASVSSMILWGPPGCGKTTLAKIIAQKCRSSTTMRFVTLSATMAGVADVKEAVKCAKNEQMFGRRTVLFVDEIHRFNKLQQDTFLPHVESGTIILVGATTENPSFHINSALLSRCHVIVLEKLSIDDLRTVVDRALVQLGITKVVSAADVASVEVDAGSISINSEAAETLIAMSDGDARCALNALEFIVNAKLASEHGSDNGCVISNGDVKNGLVRSHVVYDRLGDEHYNCISALHKSIRGSDDNAAMYWLARMIEGGEDALFVARRLIVCASEDIGLADAHALPLAVATYQACHFIGLPECAENLAHCVAYLSRAAKSNEAYAALCAARDAVRQHRGPQPAVPLHLRNATTQLARNMGHGAGYRYNPDVDATGQTYLPQELLGTSFFKSSTSQMPSTD